MRPDRERLESKATGTPGGRRIVVGVTGASGVVYAQRLVRFLLANETRVLLSVSAAGRLVIKEELREEGAGSDRGKAAATKSPWVSEHDDHLEIYPERDFFAPFCSGTFRFDAMAIIPASMGTVGAIANGVCLNNIHRGADVALKEGRRLVIVPRESPLSAIHLENLLRLARAGATIVPPSPAFYQHPETLDDAVDFVVSRVLDALGIDNDLFARWREDEAR